MPRFGRPPKPAFATRYRRSIGKRAVQRRLQPTTGGCKLNTWMQDRYPLTVAQLRKTKEDLAAMQERAEEISRLMTAGYGASDPKAIRAGEINSAIQRLEWELERSAGNSADATTA